MTDKKRKKKHPLRIFLGFGILVLTLAAVIAVLYGNLILSAMSFSKIKDQQAYTAHIRGDMYFDDYLKQGDVRTSGRLMDFIAGKLTFGLAHYELKDHGCSAYTAVTPEGDYLLCANIDQHLFDERTPILASLEGDTRMFGIANAGNITKSSDGLDLKDRLLCSFIPYLMISGSNDEGLAVSAATAAGSSCRDTEKPDLYDSAVVYAVLDHASNVDEALKFLAGYDNARDDGDMSHYMLADKDGNTAVVEWNDGEMCVFRPEDGKKYLVMTNFALKTMNGFGMDRYESYETALGACGGVLSEKDALHLLTENVIESDKMWSVVFNLNKGTALVCFRGDDSKTYSYQVG